MDNTQKAAVLNGMQTAMREAGEVLLHPPAYKVMHKNSLANFATEIDIQVQKLLVQRLCTVLPGAAFLLEEGNHERAGENEYTFVVDPIDGTYNFTRNLNYSSLSVAVLQNESPLLGAVYNPWRDEMFTAGLGQGAFCNGEPIYASQNPMEKALVCVGSSPYYEDLKKKSAEVYAQVFAQCADVRRFGSAALELCYVAAGRMEVFFELLLQPWDFAAGALVATEAGALVAATGGATLHYTRPVGILAANTACFGQMQKLLA